MRRALVVGSCGAGKTRFSLELGRKTGLPLIHLDRCYWKPGWVKPTREEWRETVSTLIRGESWILDGNYASSFDLRMPVCDTVIFLDYPRGLCLRRTLKRRLGPRERPDMAPGCAERVDLDFLRYVWSFPRLHRPRILEALESFGRGKRVETLRSPAEAERFLRGL